MNAHFTLVPLARVAESADAYGSGPYGETRGGSSPLASTKRLVLPAIGEQLQTRQCQIIQAYFAPDFLLAAQRAFISSESFLRPAGVSWPFFFAGVAGAGPLSLAQRALAAAASFARVVGEK